MNHKKILNYLIVFTTGMITMMALFSFTHSEEQGYILEHENDLKKDEPAPHNGGGNSTVYNFFNNASNNKLIFKKRILHKDAAIGYHLQKEEEIYYIAGGNGEMTMNNKTFNVKAGDAILTLPGSSHGLKQTGDNDLVVIINYER